MTRRPLVPAALLLLASCDPTGGPPARIESTKAALTVSKKRSWTQFGGDSTHRNSNPDEWILTPNNVAQLTPLFTSTVPFMNTSFVLATNRPVGGGTYQDLAFAADSLGTVHALDAYSGREIWKIGLTNPVTKRPLTQLVPRPTLAIDPTLTYVYSVGGDGTIRKIDIANQVEVQSGGFPAQFVDPSNSFTNFNNTGLTIGTTTAGDNYIYAGLGYCDGGNCVGSVTAVHLLTAQQLTFNAMCSNKTTQLKKDECVVDKTLGGGGAGVWARAGVTFDPATQRAYFTTGNGKFNPASYFYGDSMLALSPNGNGGGAGRPVRNYTPSNYDDLQGSDLDLGSTAPLILPNNGSKYPHLAALGGKDRLMRLVNLDALSTGAFAGQGDVTSTKITPLADDSVNHNLVIAPMSTWINPVDSSTWVYVSVQNSSHVIAYQLTIANQIPTLTEKWTQTCAVVNGTPQRCGGIFVANGVAYYSNGADLVARDATTGALLWTGTGVPSNNGSVTPVVVNGVLYASGTGKAWALPNGTFQRGRIDGSSTYDSKEPFVWPAALTYGPPYDADADQRRFTPGAYTGVLDSSTYNQVAWSMGNGALVSGWTKGSETSRVTTPWNKTFLRREVWEFDHAPQSTARHATGGADVAVFPADDTAGAIGVRRHNGKSMIVYRGTDRGLHALYWDATALVWSYDPMEHDFTDDTWVAASDPTAFKRSSKATSILYKPTNCDSCVAEYRVLSPPAKLYATPLPYSFRASTVPVGMRDYNGVAMIFATTTDGVYQLTDIGTSETDVIYSTKKVFGPFANTIDGSPAPYVRSDHATAVVFRYENGNVHHLYEAVLQPAGNWAVANISAAAGSEEAEATIADPIAFVTDDGKDTVIYRTVSQGVFQLQRTAPSAATWVRTKLN
jgi:hypothetical protein